MEIFLFLFPFFTLFILFFYYLIEIENNIILIYSKRAKICFKYIYMYFKRRKIAFCICVLAFFLLSLLHLKNFINS